MYVSLSNERQESDIELLKGKVLTEIIIDKDPDEIFFICRDGKRYKMYHDQDCCEKVYIEDICGDIDDLIGSVIVIAEESVNFDNPKEKQNEGWDDDNRHRWTFYKLATAKGYVTIRWYGESNGYYSEKVDFEEMEEDEEI